MDFKTGRMMILPPSPDKCRYCAVKHDSWQPHDWTSLYYHMRFKMAHGRDATMADAFAHCSEAVRLIWVEKLQEMFPDMMVRWSEPPDGIEPIVERIDG